MLSYTSTRAMTDFETATHYAERQHKPTLISATHAQTAFRLQPRALRRHYTSVILCNSLPAMKTEFKSFRNTTLITASSKRLLLHRQRGRKSARQEFLMRSL